MIEINSAFDMMQKYRMREKVIQVIFWLDNACCSRNGTSCCDLGILHTLVGGQKTLTSNYNIAHFYIIGILGSIYLGHDNVCLLSKGRLDFGTPDLAPYHGFPLVIVRIRAMRPCI